MPSVGGGQNRQDFAGAGGRAVDVGGGGEMTIEPKCQGIVDFIEQLRREMLEDARQVVAAEMAAIKAENTELKAKRGCSARHVIKDVGAGLPLMRYDFAADILDGLIENLKCGLSPKIYAGEDGDLRCDECPTIVNIATLNLAAKVLRETPEEEGI